MNTKQIQLLSLSIFIILFGFFSSCSSDDENTKTEQHAPTAPKLKMPENKAELNLGEEIKLMWEASTDADKDPIKYNVYLSEKDKSELELLKSGITSTFYNIEKTLPEGTYQWKIEATDGKHKTSSDLFSFKVEKIYGLALSTDNVYLKVEGTKQVNITSGSGNYIVSSNKMNIATADLSGTTINITSKSEGTAEITVTDTKTNQSKKITVTVKNLVIAKDRLDLKTGGEISVDIASGSGNYSVSSDKPDVAMVELSGTEVKITGKTKGIAIITVTDNLTEETKQITVKVNSLEVSNTEVSVEVDKAVTLQITSGSGDYSTSIVKNKEVATSELNGTTITIAGKAEGTTIVTVFDNILRDRKQINVTVTAKPVTIPDGVVIENGVLKSWPCDKIPSNGHVDIPNTVTSIGKYAFSDCKNLTSLNIPASVIEIGYGAFMSSGIASIKIPNSVTSIGSRAFLDCQNLKSIEIPNSVKEMGEDVFTNSKNLESVKLSNSIKTIKGNTFFGCSKLTSIEIPNSVKTLGSGAFANCTSLTSISIPSSVTNIERHTFQRCEELRSVTIQGNSLVNIGYWAFSRCSKLESINLPDSVESIEEGVFYGCYSLMALVIPKGVKEIGKDAFIYSSIREIHIKALEPPLIKEGIVFSKKLFVPKGTKTKYEQAKGWKECNPIVEED
ncbi:leucine-rich repeat domain-containing protein [Weeksellaceae bacterium TAE3-ERU29]|nr:leucine-rich repeat domain-containing protein [Weeksellaceae bacterium TAE3-ERU29]